MGGMLCEIIGNTSFNQNRSLFCRNLSLFLMFVFLPVLLLVLSIVMGFTLPVLYTEQLWKLRCLRKLKPKNRLSSLFSKFKLVDSFGQAARWILYLILAFLSYFTLVTVYLVVAAIIIGLSYSVLLVPFYFYAIFILIRKGIIWREIKT
jgi:hypothetical protein